MSKYVCPNCEYVVVAEVLAGWGSIEEFERNDQDGTVIAMETRQQKDQS